MDRSWMHGKTPGEIEAIRKAVPWMFTDYTSRPGRVDVRPAPHPEPEPAERDLYFEPDLDDLEWENALIMHACD